MGTVYIASKTKHAPKWRKLRDELGYPIISTWIDEAGEGQSSDLRGLASRCIKEASEATCTVVYGEQGEILKGALIEIGSALGSGKPVICVGTWENFKSVFQSHPLWRSSGSVETAMLMGLEMGLEYLVAPRRGAIVPDKWI